MTGKSHSLFLSDEGKVLSTGQNGSGQCGIGKGKDRTLTPKLINYMGPEVEDVSRSLISLTVQLLPFYITNFSIRETP